MASHAPPTRRESRMRRTMHRWTDRSAINPFYKYVLFFLNFIFLMLGIAATAISAYVLVQKHEKVTSVFEFFFDFSCLLCLGGSITTFISFFGCGGALRENVWFLRIYYWSLSFLLFLQVVLIVFVFIFFFVEDVAVKLNLVSVDDLNRAIEQYGISKDGGDVDRDLMDLIDNWQENLGCCGVSNDDEGFRDWNKNEYFNCTSDADNPENSRQCSVPISCCKEENPNYLCGRDVLKAQDPSEVSHSIYTRGCLKAVKDFLTDNVWIVGGIVIGIILPQAILVCMTKTLVAQILEQLSKW